MVWDLGAYSFRIEFYFYMMFCKPRLSHENTMKGMVTLKKGSIKGIFDMLIQWTLHNDYVILRVSCTAATTSLYQLNALQEHLCKCSRCGIHHEDKDRVRCTNTGLGKKRTPLCFDQCTPI